MQFTCLMSCGSQICTLLFQISFPKEKTLRSSNKILNFSGEFRALPASQEEAPVYVRGQLESG